MLLAAEILLLCHLLADCGGNVQLAAWNQTSRTAGEHPGSLCAHPGQRSERLLQSQTASAHPHRAHRGKYPEPPAAGTATTLNLLIQEPVPVKDAESCCAL